VPLLQMMNQFQDVRLCVTSSSACNASIQCARRCKHMRVGANTRVLQTPSTWRRSAQQTPALGGCTAYPPCRSLRLFDALQYHQLGAGAAQRNLKTRRRKPAKHLSQPPGAAATKGPAVGAAAVIARQHHSPPPGAAAKGPAVGAAAVTAAPRTRRPSARQMDVTPRRQSDTSHGKPNADQSESRAAEPESESST